MSDNFPWVVYFVGFFGGVAFMRFIEWFIKIAKKEHGEAKTI